MILDKYFHCDNYTIEDNEISMREVWVKEDIGPWAQGDFITELRFDLSTSELVAYDADFTITNSVEIDLTIKPKE